MPMKTMFTKMTLRKKVGILYNVLALFPAYLSFADASGVPPTPAQHGVTTGGVQPNPQVQNTVSPLPAFHSELKKAMLMRRPQIGSDTSGAEEPDPDDTDYDTISDTDSNAAGASGNEVAIGDASPDEYFSDGFVDRDPMNPGLFKGLSAGTTSNKKKHRTRQSHRQGSNDSSSDSNSNAPSKTRSIKQKPALAPNPVLPSNPASPQTPTPAPHMPQVPPQPAYTPRSPATPIIPANHAATPLAPPLPPIRTLGPNATKPSTSQQVNNTANQQRSPNVAATNQLTLKEELAQKLATFKNQANKHTVSS